MFKDDTNHLLKDDFSLYFSVFLKAKKLRNRSKEVNFTHLWRLDVIRQHQLK